VPDPAVAAEPPLAVAAIAAACVALLIETVDLLRSTLVLACKCGNSDP
jgi:hypothetical protein